MSESSGSSVVQLAEAFMRKQEELNNCKSAEEVISKVTYIVSYDPELSDKTREYGKKFIWKLGKARDLTGALGYVYNIILAGDEDDSFSYRGGR